MKLKFLFAIFFVFWIFLSGCALTEGIRIGLPDKECHVCDDILAEMQLAEQENRMPTRFSYMCKIAQEKEINLCSLNDMMVIVAKEGYVLDAYSAAEFTTWATSFKNRIINGISFQEAKYFAFKKITDMNKMVGGTLMVLSDFFLQMPDAVLVPKDDADLIVQGVDIWVAEVQKLAAWFN